ncbi:variant surface glycoprotein, (VSG), putative [Trypanosoma vivax Y486]|uniref:Variant surface glycoprotein, (VSG), putative n=1 Tax=Trypanosoma vivax (strain Y486) TaxID=1055687 RepID=F9WVC2_TRYVY|nr:variant surface glycoprotein, (VSG), putative [Trypanosoma vivax Y486]|eukprot:CCD21529.1 variant surface glycoprotein, (VSG), putative [Trypanosoma vivax Y486]
MHKLALAVFCVIAARTSQRALAGEPNAGDTVEDFRKVCVATHALGAVKSLSEAIAGRVKEATASARGVGEELEGQLRIKRSARQLVTQLAPSCLDSSEEERAQKNASALVVCAADATNKAAVKLKQEADTAAAEAVDGKKEGGTALARLASAIGTGSNNGWTGNAQPIWQESLKLAMIYLCNNANSGPNGCGTTTGTNCPCVPPGYTAKNSNGERSSVETTPKIIHTGRKNKDGAKDSGEWTKLKQSAAVTEAELKTNLNAAMRICEALEGTTTHHLNTADTIEQTISTLLRAMKRNDAEGATRCLGHMHTDEGCDGSSGEKGACICYKPTRGNTTEISWASKALTAVHALRSLLRTEKQAEQLNTLAAAWAGTQEHTQQQHGAGQPRTRRTAATAREHTSTPTASPRDNSQQHQQNDSTEQQTEDGARGQCEKDGGTWDPKEHACNNTAKKDTTHTRRTLDAALTLATLALTASAWR